MTHVSVFTLSAPIHILPTPVVFLSVCPRATNPSTHTSLSHSIPHLCAVTLRAPPVRSGWPCSPQCSRCWPRLQGELSNFHSYISAQGCGHKHTATSAKSSRKAETCQGPWGRAEPQTQQNLRREVSAAPGTSHSSQPCPTHPPPTPQPQHPWPVNGQGLSALTGNSVWFRASSSLPTSSPAPSNRGS